MLRTMMKSKIHRATVTQADLHYVGSVTVDEDLLDAADLLPGELVHIVDVTNGARLETYTIAGERGSGVIGINGAAARLVHPGDLVILIGYGQMDDRGGQGVPAARGLRRRRQQDPGDRLRPGRDLRRARSGPRRPARRAHSLSMQWLDAPVRRVPGRLRSPPDPGWTTTADVVVIGSGIAGLTAALRLRGQVDKVLVVTKDVLAAGSTQWAQGGIAAALGPGGHPRAARASTPWSPAPARATSTPCGCW